MTAAPSAAVPLAATAPGLSVRGPSASDPSAPDYLLVVDGGGSSSRALLANRQGEVLARAVGGPAALSLGMPVAVRAVHDLLAQLAHQHGKPVLPGDCRALLGMAGAHHPAWRRAFALACAAFSTCQVYTDGDTSLAGAHAGQPGAVIAIGTGVIGEALLPDGQRRTVSGWGFPVGDEGGGAWLGWRAVQRTLHSRDGRCPPSLLTHAIAAHLGDDTGQCFDWLGRARAADYAALAPTVLACADSDAYAATLLQQAGAAIALVAEALDPDGTLPLALLGGLAQPLQPCLPAALRARCQQPQHDALQGGLYLARQLLPGTGCDEASGAGVGGGVGT